MKDSSFRRVQRHVRPVLLGCHLIDLPGHGPICDQGSVSDVRGGSMYGNPNSMLQNLKALMTVLQS